MSPDLIFKLSWATKNSDVQCKYQRWAPAIFSLVCFRHRWASTSISMPALSDIRHRHLLFQYQRQICRTEKRHSDIGTVPISTSEFIPISDIKEKNYFS